MISSLLISNQAKVLMLSIKRRWFGIYSASLSVIDGARVIKFDGICGGSATGTAIMKALFSEDHIFRSFFFLSNKCVAALWAIPVAAGRKWKKKKNYVEDKALQHFYLPLPIKNNPFVPALSSVTQARVARTTCPFFFFYSNLLSCLYIRVHSAQCDHYHRHRHDITTTTAFNPPCVFFFFLYIERDLWVIINCFGR